MTTYLDAAQVETYIAACAARSGTTVEWTEPGSTPQTNGKVMWLPAISSSCTPDDLIKLRYAVKHETSHIVHTPFDYYVQRQPKGLLMFIINLLEDNRVDYLNDREWPGDMRLSDKYATIFAAQVEAMEGDLNDDLQKVAPLFAWEALSREWIPSFPLAESVIKRKGLSSPVNAERYATLCAGDYTERLLALRTMDKPEEDEYTLACDILRDIYGKDPAKYTNKDEAGKGKGRGKEGEDRDDGEGSGEGGGDDEDRLITVDKLEKHFGEHVVSRTGVNCTAEPTSGSYTIPLANEYHVIRFPIADSVKHTTFSGRSMDGSVSLFKKAVVQQYIANTTHSLSNKLRLKLQVRAQGRYESNKKTGTLHSGSLHKLISAKGTDTASKVFRQHIVSDTLDTAVCLLVDCSGSMNGEKFEAACSGAASMAEALRPLHIATEVLGFTNTRGADDPIIWMFKGWNEVVPTTSMVERFNIASTALMENTDGDAIAWAASSLLTRKEHRKILIVLSDGNPAGRGHKGEIKAYTAQVVKSIEQGRAIEIYGIGIMSTAVQHYYKNHVVINTPNELSSSILSIIDRAL